MDIQNPYEKFPPFAVSPYNTVNFVPLGKDGITIDYGSCKDQDDYGNDDNQRRRRIAYYWTPARGLVRTRVLGDHELKKSKDIISDSEYVSDLASLLIIWNKDDPSFLTYASETLKPMSNIIHQSPKDYNEEALEDNSLLYLADMISEERYLQLVKANEHYPGLLLTTARILFLHNITLDDINPEIKIFETLLLSKIKLECIDEIVSLFTRINQPLIEWKFGLREIPQMYLVKEMIFNSQNHSAYEVSEPSNAKRKVLTYLCRKIKERKVAEDGTEASNILDPDTLLTLEDRNVFSRYLERATYLVFKGYFSNNGYVATNGSKFLEAFGISDSVVYRAFSEDQFDPPKPAEIKTIVGLIKYIQLLILTAEYEERIGFSIDYDKLEFGSFSEIYRVITCFISERFYQAHKEFYDRFGFFFVPERTHFSLYSHLAVGLSSEQFKVLCEYVNNFTRIVARAELFGRDFKFDIRYNSIPFSALIDELEESLKPRERVFSNPFDAFKTKEEITDYLAKCIKYSGIETIDEIPQQHNPDFKYLFIMSNSFIRRCKAIYGLTWTELLYDACCLSFTDFRYSHEFYYEGITCEEDLIEKILEMLPEDCSFGVNFSLTEQLPLFPTKLREIRLVKLDNCSEFKRYLSLLGTSLVEIRKKIIERNKNK